MIARRLAALAAAGWIVLSGAAAGVDLAPESIAPFSDVPEGPAMPSGWRPTTVPGVSRPTVYDIVRDEGVSVLRARARAAMSGLDHIVSVDPDRKPILSWRWKVTRPVNGGAAGTKQGDDYSARVYVFFDYDLNRLGFLARSKVKLARALHGDAVPAAALCYVWDARAPVGTVMPSAYTDRVRMIVLDSGAADAGRWISHSRNVAEDFRKAFGEAPPRVTGVAVATDTDNTGDDVTAWFGDLRFDGPTAPGPAR